MLDTPNMCSEGMAPHVVLVLRAVEVAREVALEAVDAIGGGELSEALEDDGVAVDEADALLFAAHEGDPRPLPDEDPRHGPRMRQYCRMNLLSYPAPLWAITVVSLFASENSQSQNFTSQP